MATKRVIKRSANSEQVLISEAFDEFINEKEAHNLAPSTVNNYKQTFAKFMDFCGYDNSTPTELITINPIYKWINSMKIDNVKPTSINHYLRDLRTFLYWCMDTDRKYIDPPFKIKQIEAQEEQMKMFTDDELDLLLEKPTRRDGFGDWRSWCIVNWVLGTGNRASTICNVKISDINFSRREIVLGHTKNKKAQIIPLSSSLETVVKEYIKIWRKDADTDAWLFPNVGEEQLTTNALRLAFGRYCKSRGVQKSNIHGLRHNFAKGWVQNNGNMFALQKILGHSTLDMTRRYVKLFAEDIKEDYDSFSTLDQIKKSGSRRKTVKRADS